MKGYAAHERGTLEAVVQARNAAVAAQAPQQAKAENALSGALRQLFALAEAYPDLKANDNFRDCRRSSPISRTSSPRPRRFFNNAVSEYNAGIQRFPAALFAAPWLCAKVLRPRRRAQPR